MWISPLKYQIMKLEKKIDRIMGGRRPELHLNENSSSHDQSSEDPSTSAGDASAVAGGQLHGNCKF